MKKRNPTVYSDKGLKDSLEDALEGQGVELLSYEHLSEHVTDPAPQYVFEKDMLYRGDYYPDHFDYFEPDTAIRGNKSYMAMKWFQCRGTLRTSPEEFVADVLNSIDDEAPADAEVIYAAHVNDSGFFLGANFILPYDG